MRSSREVGQDRQGTGRLSGAVRLFKFKVFGCRIRSKWKPGSGIELPCGIGK